MNKKNTPEHNFKHNFFEKKAWESSLYICGIDEAGRGALAGPVVAAAVILPLNTKQKFLRDSKLMSKQERDLAYNWIIKNCFYSAAFVCHKSIDQVNIYQATRIAMRKALTQTILSSNLNLTKLKYIIIDAVPIQIPQAFQHENLSLHAFNFGESISSSIAAASIVAKVTRDRTLDNMSKVFPAFNFEKHKGYGTKDHTQAIQLNIRSIIHRKTFLTKLTQKADEKKLQQSLF
ncbi:MAG: ribonuclease HII [bacterium]